MPQQRKITLKNVPMGSDSDEDALEADYLLTPSEVRFRDATFIQPCDLIIRSTEGTTAKREF